MVWHGEDNLLMETNQKVQSGRCLVASKKQEDGSG